MTEKNCGRHNEGQCRRRILQLATAIVIATAFVILLVWAILHPKKPHFILQTATINAFKLSNPPNNRLTSNFQITLSSTNPNSRIGIFYEKLDVYASYRNQQVTLATLLPETYQGHKDVSVWSPFLYGDSVPVDPYIGSALNQDLSDDGLVMLNIKVDGWVKWKVGTWVSGRYRMHINCPAFVNFGSGGGGGVSAPVKYQLVQRCSMDV